MSTKPPLANLDYIDHDVAYLLGLLLARGEFHQEGDTRRLVVTFPYRQAVIPGALPHSPDRETAIRLGLDDIRRRIQELLETTVEVERHEHQVTLRAVFTRNTIGWRDLRYLTGHRNHYTEFELPDFAVNFDRETKIELMRGFSDAASDPNPADADRAGRHRVVLQFQFGNWKLPIQVCHFLQHDLGIPVSHILWGHPNIRSPGGGSGWAKETRMRIYAEAFEPVGYYFRYKQEIFEGLLRKNRGTGTHRYGLCNPKAKTISARSRKPRHCDEKDERLPQGIRGRHFDAYFQICKRMGCKQGKKSPQLEIFTDEDSD
jgi:hypothetical protein